MNFWNNYSDDGDSGGGSGEENKGNGDSSTKRPHRNAISGNSKFCRADRFRSINLGNENNGHHEMILEPSCSVCDGVCAARDLYTGAYCSFPITMYAWMYVWIHVCSFTFLTDIYSEHWTNPIPCLEWFKIYFYELCQCICWYTHSPPRPSFCFSDYLDLCTKAKQFSNSWGSIFPLPIRFHWRAIHLTLTLGGSTMTPRRSVVAMKPEWQKFFFFFKKLTVFEIMNMQWLPVVLKLQSRGWHPPTRTLCSCRTG